MMFIAEHPLLCIGACVIVCAFRWMFEQFRDAPYEHPYDSDDERWR